MVCSPPSTPVRPGNRLATLRCRFIRSSRSPDRRRRRSSVTGGPAGIQRSEDRGISWSTTLTGSPITTLAGSRDRSGAGIVLAGTEADGVFRSDDGGVHWVSASAGLFDLEALDHCPVARLRHRQHGVSRQRNRSVSLAERRPRMALAATPRSGERRAMPGDRSGFHGNRCVARRHGERWTGQVRRWRSVMGGGRVVRPFRDRRAPLVPR